MCVARYRSCQHGVGVLRSSDPFMLATAGDLTKHYQKMRISLFFPHAALLIVALCLGPGLAQSAELAKAPAITTIDYTSHRYASKNGQDLYLDLIFDPAAAPPTDKRPVIIYSFGGGWEGGDRGSKRSVDMWHDLLSAGIAVIAIDYRLGIKETKRTGEFTQKNGTEMYLRAIQWSVEDIFDATSFVLSRASEWKLDPEQIILLGGSSGATNSLVAEYNVANSTAVAKERLPKGFRYAGVISMAGAFWLPAGTPLQFTSKPAPIMFFHGAKDWLVTYDEVQDQFSGYGPAYFFRKFPGPQYPKWFVDYPEGDHLIAGLPMVNRQLEMRAFIQRMVKERQQLSIHTIENSEPPSNFGGLLRLEAPKPVN